MAAMLAFLMAVCCCVPCVTVFAKSSSGYKQAGDLSTVFGGGSNSASDNYFGNIAYNVKSDENTMDSSKFYNQAAYDALMKDVDKFLAEAPKNGSDYDKEKFVYDKIATTCTYKTDGYAAAADKGSVQAILYDHGGICSDFAYAFKYFCNKLNINCWQIDGTLGGGPHAFNIVELDGKHYITDVTSALSGKEDVSPDYSYMNMSKRQAQRLGYEQADYDKEWVDWSDCKYDDQDYFKKNNLYFTSYEAMKTALPAIIAKANNDGNPVVRVEFPQNTTGDAIAKSADSKLFAGGDMGDVLKKANLLTPYPVQVKTSYGANHNYMSFPISSSHVPEV